MRGERERSGACELPSMSLCLFVYSAAAISTKSETLG